MPDLLHNHSTIHTAQSMFSQLRTRDTHGLLLPIMALSVAARLGSALYQGNHIETLPGIYDQVSYHTLALRVLGGHGFSFGTDWWPATAAGMPTAHWSYLYVLYLTAVYFLFGPNPLAAKIIQALLAGILQPLLLWRLTRRTFNSKVAIAAAILVSVYGYFVYYGGALVTESFYIVTILWVLDIATRLGRRQDAQEAGQPADDSLRTGLWIWLGVACGLAILLRQVIIFAVPVVLAWTLWRIFKRDRTVAGFSSRRLVRRAVLSMLIAACFILPWTIRNYAAFGRFVLLNTNAGFVFFWGNHPFHKTHFIPIIGGGKQYASLIPDELRGLNEAELDRHLLQRGLHFVVEDPSRFALLSLSRTEEYFKFWPTHKSGAVSSIARVLSSGVYLPLFLTGLIVAAFRLRPGHQQDNLALILLLLLAGQYTLIHLLTWTLVRYRLPVDALMMPFGALGLVFLRDWVANRVPRRKADDAVSLKSSEC